MGSVRGVHDDRALVERRIARELWERVVPLVEVDRTQLGVEAGPTLDRLTDFAVGSRWGAPWGTTWFRLTGEIPEHWAGRRVEAVIDLGFHRDAAGFQCEGLVRDDAGRPVQGIHPRRTNVAVDAGARTGRAHRRGGFEPVVPAVPPVAARFAGDGGRGAAVPVRARRAGRRRLRGRGADARPRRPRRVDAHARRSTIRAGGGCCATSNAPSISSPTSRPPATRSRPALAMPARSSAHRIIATGHAHIDTAWLWPIRETKRKCDAHVRVGRAADGRAPRVPVRRARRPSSTRGSRSANPSCSPASPPRSTSGQWIPIGGMWVESDMNLPSGESLVRQIVHGQRYFEQHFGRRCTEVWIPDVFGYPAGLPQVFAAGGHDALRDPEAVVEQAEPVPAPHVLVGGARRHPRAHPLPTRRHLQRRDHAGRVRPRCAPTSPSTAGATGR